MLELKNISASYGAIKVLKNISVAVNDGEIVSLIGANGAGKTTILKVISRIMPITDGTILYEGAPIERRAAFSLIASGMAHVPEGRRVFPRLTVDENLILGAFTVSDPSKITTMLDEVRTLFPILYERRSQLAGTLSGGEQQMLAIARALMSKPKLLLLDEPSMGVAPQFVEKIFNTIVQLNREGMTILLVEQNAAAALAIAQRGYVIETGTITLTDTGKNLLADSRVLEAYLGA